MPLVKAVEWRPVMKKEKENKILKVTMPEITSYPIYAHFLAIMQTHAETRDWILSSFMQICSNSKVLNFYDFNYTSSPFLKVQRIEKAFLKEWSIDIMHFIFKSITQGFYVYLLVKKRYIAAYGLSNLVTDNQDESVHNIMIYGFDMREKVFYIADNFAHGKYAFSKCGFSDLEEAIRHMRQEDENQGGFNGTVELIKYRGDFCPDLSVKRIYEGLSDYYECRPTGMWNIMHINNYNRNRKWYFGQECFEYIEIKIRELDWFSIQDFHLMWEHKVHLRNVFEYLIEMQYIHDAEAVCEMDSIAQKTLCARNLITKYNTTGKSSIKDSIIEQYKNIRENESKLIYRVIRQLEKCDMERLMHQNEK